MATQRRGKTEEANNGGVQEVSDDQTGESTRRQARLEQKLKFLKAQQRYRTFRWMLIVLVLILAVIGFYYYLTYYQTDLSSLKETGEKTTRAKKPKSAPEKTKEPSKKVTKDDKTSTKSKPKSTPEKPSKKVTKDDKTSTKSEQATKNTKKEPNAQTKKDTKTKRDAKSKTDTGSKKQTNSGAKQYSKFENGVRTEDLDLETIRILRRPIHPSDVDRPLIIEILNGDNLLRDGLYTDALEKFNSILKKFPQSPRSLYGKAVALSHMAAEKKSNKLLDSAIDFFTKSGLEDESFLGPEALKIAALEGLTESAMKRGKHSIAVKALEELTELKPESVLYANQLGSAYLSAGSTKKAKAQFQASIEKFTQNYYSKAQLGFVLYTEQRFEEALPLLLEGIRNSEDVKSNPKFYLYAGDTLTHLNRTEEAFALYGEAVAMDMFPSLWQRSIFNEPDLRALPWWTLEETGYLPDIQRLKKALATITSEAKLLLTGGSNKAAYSVLFNNGKKDAKNCQTAPKTCALIESFPEAADCRRGSVKISLVPPLSHIAPYVGPTNTKLQIVLGLKVTDGLSIRVADETRQLTEGQVLVLDESFEQEVWLRSAEPAVVMVIDVWHPDLGDDQKRKLGPIQ